MRLSDLLDLDRPEPVTRSEQLIAQAEARLDQASKARNRHCVSRHTRAWRIEINGQVHPKQYLRRDHVESVPGTAYARIITPTGIRLTPLAFIQLINVNS